ncbi:MAG TPA: hypothetical protein VKU40_04790, partial [Thermoanaerobaculia bacterium]|nr:hypothetical protein [Thermoanaerobaculia bacterium]
GIVVLVLDPGRRGGGEGRVLLWTRRGCGGGAGEAGAGDVIAPEQVASAFLRALGMPQSAELPEPPPACDWPPPPTRLPTFGPRQGGERSPGDAGEYLESLRSLGYL